MKWHPLFPAKDYKEAFDQLRNTLLHETVNVLKDKHLIMCFMGQWPVFHMFQDQALIVKAFLQSNSLHRV